MRWFYKFAEQLNSRFKNLQQPLKGLDFNSAFNTVNKNILLNYRRIRGFSTVNDNK